MAKFATVLLMQEIQRVLKPGGKFFYMEHILAKEGDHLRPIQQAFTKVGYSRGSSSEK
jgi:hypothetical protein